MVDFRGDSYDISGRLDLPGHRSDVRCLALSADDTQVCVCMWTCRNLCCDVLCCKALSFPQCTTRHCDWTSCCHSDNMLCCWHALLLLPVMAMPPDDVVAQLLSGSNAGCKLWSPATGACLGSIDTGYALCCAYVPGNRHAVIGTKV